jgi:hypothetical protein
MQQGGRTNWNVPDVVGNARMRGAEYKPTCDDVGGATGCWWIMVGIRLNIADTIERRPHESIGNGSNGCGG